MQSDLNKRFTLGERITDEQMDFFQEHGFIHFAAFASPTEVQGLRDGIEDVEKQWLADKVDKVNGIPIKYGEDEAGQPFVQRYAFTSLYSQAFHHFVNDTRFEPIKRLIGDDCRVGEHEKDGVVVNHYLNVKGSAYKRLGWHTDGLRDIFYGRMPGPMLNVGVYLDDSPKKNGGLRLIPGSHTQGFWKMVFGKLHFISHRADKREICVEAKAGDLTVHDGRLWHRVARASMEGTSSRRRIMYVPFINGPYEPKNAESKTPFYHRLQRITRL